MVLRHCGCYFHTHVRHRFLPTLSPSRHNHHVSITPSDVLVDEKVKITSSGFRPQEKVTVYAYLNEKQSQFSACGHYICDDNGSIDVSIQPSVGGSYKGVAPMGLFWAMRASPYLPDNTFTNDITKPSSFRVSVIIGHHSLRRLQLDDEILTHVASANVNRRWMTSDVKRTSLVFDKIKGSLFLPAGPGPFHGILDLSDCSGHFTETRSALLASKGYATLSLAYWGHQEERTSSMKPDFAYFMDAADWLSAHPMVVTDQIGVLGFSKGGQYGLLLAQHNPKVKAVVNVSGAPFCMLEDLNWRDSPFHQGISIDYSKIREIMTRCFIVKDYVPEWRHHLIKAWAGDAKCLYINGADDQFLSPSYARYWYELIPKEKKSNFELVTYSRTGHVIDVPNTPMCRMAFHKILNFAVFMGGFNEPQAKAKKDSWQKILNFFKKNLKYS